MSETNPDKLKFIEQYLIAYMVSRSTERRAYQDDKSLAMRQINWAKEGLKEAYSAWDAIVPLRMNNYNL